MSSFLSIQFKNQSTILKRPLKVIIIDVSLRDCFSSYMRGRLLVSVLLLTRKARDACEQ